MELADVPRYRPLAFDKMESLIKEMQDPENGVPVRSQKLFLSVIPSAFTGYDLVEWLMERFNLDETSNVEAINLGNQLCQYGYFFPVNDLKNLVLKDDSSLYRFQSPYYWPWQAPRVAGGSSAPTLGPDNVEYAIYLVKRTLRNKQRHGLEDYEQEALANLKKNLSAKWDFITMQAEEQVRLAKERKKGDKIVSDSQERAYWRVARPPPGVPSALEPCPVPVRARHPRANKKRTVHQVKKEIEHLKASLDRTRVKTSIALEALMAYSETFAPYDPWLTPPQPSNPWVSDDTLFWQINSPLVDVPSEKRVQRWALSIEELVSDPTGLQEFTSFLRKEYSHENIRFWTAVMDLRRSSTKQIPKKLQEIYEEFLAPGAPCEINIDGATAERVSAEIRSGSRYALDHAAGHVYSLLLKKDCYPRFVRSDHFQRLLVEGKNVHQKKAKFFNFGGGQVKKKPAAGACGTSGAGLARRRGSDRSLSGSAHELALMGAARAAEPPAHAHSHSNLAEADDEALPWESAGPPRRRQDSAADSGSSSSDVSAVPAPPAAERARRLPQQSTLDGGLRGAPPPLRRLSAVEPRHLAPLASPPRPVPAPAPPPAPPPVPSAHHPTPTISVSSAPEEDSTHGSASPEEPRSLAVSDEPSSVFASTAATPTDPRLDGELSTGSESRSTLRADEDEAPASAEEPAPGELASTSRVGEVASGRLGEVASGEISGGRRDEVASGGRLGEIAPDGQLGEILSGRLHEVATSSRLAEIASGSQLREVSVCRLDEVASGSRLGEIAPDVRHDAIASGSGRGEIASGFRLDEVASCSRLDEVSSSVRHVEVASGSGAGEVGPGGRVDEVASGSRMGEVGSCAWLGEFASASIEEEVPTPPVAPLAVGEDIGAEDDPADKVPSPPPPPPPAPAPAHPASESDATKLIAHRDRHKDEVTSVSESSIVKRGGKGGGERAQRNDICPWEDENSCESDAPFVKTYATLGYL